MKPMTPWPYPRWIAHRGAGQLAPENTLAAFRLGARHGYRMFECDAKLSADGVAFLLHDATLERTTNGQGQAGDQPWAALARLDAGSWHSGAYAGEPLPTLQDLARFCLSQGHALNIEIKPTPGQESLTGRLVAEQAARWWAEQAASQPEQPTPLPPLLTSFQVAALAAAQAAAPALPRGLLLHEFWDGWQEAAQALGCTALVCHHPLWTQERIAQAHEQGWRALAYTVNQAERAQQLLDWGLDCVITDRVDQLGP